MTNHSGKIYHGVNLLPADVQAGLRRRYYLGLATSFFLFAALAIGIGAGLLLPSYLLAKSGVESSARYLAAVEDTLGLKERGGAGEIVNELVERIAILKSYESQPVAVPALSAIVQSLPKGVVLQTIEIKETGDKKGMVAISGIAETRGSLVAFADFLKSVPLFDGVSVPVAQLVTDADINFSLSFALKKQ